MTQLLWLFILSISQLHGVISSEPHDVTSDMTFFCLNCNEGVSECCSGVLGLPFCCSPELYAVQKTTGVVSALEGLSLGGHVVSCQSSDQCPTVASQLISLIDQDAGGDYCCPLESLCCSLGDYMRENIGMLSCSFGGPIIFTLLVAAAMCCGCCTCCIMCRKSKPRNGGVIIATPPVGGVSIQATAIPTATAVQAPQEGLPGYQKLTNEEADV